MTPAPIRRTARPPDATGRAAHSHPAPHRAKPHQSGAPTSDRQARSGCPFAVFVLAHGCGGHGDRVARGLAGHHLLATLPPGAVRDGEPSDRCEEDDQAVTVTSATACPAPTAEPSPSTARTGRRPGTEDDSVRLTRVIAGRDVTLEAELADDAYTISIERVAAGPRARLPGGAGHTRERKASTRSRSSSADGSS